MYIRSIIPIAGIKIRMQCYIVAMTMNIINMIILIDKKFRYRGHQSIVSAYNFQCMQKITSILYIVLMLKYIKC